MFSLKFRAKTLDGEILVSNSIKIDENPETVWLRDEFYNWVEVVPTSLAQYVGDSFVNFIPVDKQNDS